MGKKATHAILLVETEQSLRNTIASLLRAEDYFVLAVADGNVALDILQENVFALLILDPTSLQSKAQELLDSLHNHSLTEHIPVLMLTAHDYETLTALERSADNWLEKPLNWEELLASVQALLRNDRKRPGKTASRSTVVHAENEQKQIVVADDCWIDVPQRKIIWEAQPVDLQNSILFDLLLYLVQHRGSIVTREQLLRELWGYDNTDDTRTVDVHMRWLRKKLQDDADHPRFLETVRGIGYRLKE